MLPEQYCYLSEITVSLFTRSQIINDVLMRYFLTLDKALWRQVHHDGINSCKYFIQEILSLDFYCSIHDLMTCNLLLLNSLSCQLFRQILIRLFETTSTFQIQKPQIYISIVLLNIKSIVIFRNTFQDLHPVDIYSFLLSNKTS